MLSIDFFGATNTVTGSKFRLCTETDQVLVDCGLFQGLKELRLRNWEHLPFDPAELDGVILTHAHIDHSGYLPRLVKRGYSGPVYATAPTVELCGLLLPDSGELQEEEAKRANAGGYSKHKPALPLYTAEDAEACLGQMVKLRYGDRRKIGSNLWVRMLDAGHILGSAIVEIWAGDGGDQTKVVFSGDLGRYGDPILNDPAPIGEADYVVIESTYGDRQHGDHSPADDLADAVNTIVSTRGVLIIPAFSVGRTQRVLYELRRLEEGNRIPSLPVYVDSPMAIDATSIFLEHSEAHRVEFQALGNGRGDHPLRCKRLRIVRSAAESAALDSMQIGPAIIVSASGMATGGRVLNHLEAYLPDSRSLVLFAGFQAAGTRGRALVEGATEVKMHGKWVQVRAEIRMIDGFSAHGDIDDLMRWLGTVQRPPFQVLLVHGESDALRSMAAHIEERFGFATHVPEYGESLVLNGRCEQT